MKSNNTVPLLDLYHRFKNGTLLLPSQQMLRGDVWSHQKKRKWWSDIEKNEMICGVIITYRIAGDKVKRRYINDGANRVIHSILPFVEKCKADKRDFEAILRNCKIVEQEVEYEDQKEAIDHYVNINMGTVATPYEILQCQFICGLEDYDMLWRPYFTELHEGMTAHLNRVGCKNKKTDRENLHRAKRDDMAMLVRFLSCERSKWSPCVGIKVLSAEKAEKEREVETRLERLLNELGRGESQNQLTKFLAWVEKQTAFFIQKWGEANMSSAVAPNFVLFRWWLSACLYLHNNKISPEKVSEFTLKLIQTSKGKAQVLYTNADQDKKAVSVALSKIGSLATVLNALELNAKDFDSGPIRRKRRTNLKPGFVNSHIDAFSHNGDGETIPENAVDNAHRLNRDMTPDELNRLIEFNSPKVA